MVSVWLPYWTQGAPTPWSDPQSFSRPYSQVSFWQTPACMGILGSVSKSSPDWRTPRWVATPTGPGHWAVSGSFGEGSLAWFSSDPTPRKTKRWITRRQQPTWQHQMHTHPTPLAHDKDSVADAEAEGEPNLTINPLYVLSQQAMKDENFGKEWKSMSQVESDAVCLLYYPVPRFHWLNCIFTWVLVSCPMKISFNSINSAAFGSLTLRWHFHTSNANAASGNVEKLCKIC